MKLVPRLIILTMALSLAGCSYLARAPFFQNRDSAYLDAKSEPPLRIPPGLSSNTFDNRYPVSDRHYPLSETDINIQPPGLYNK